MILFGEGAVRKATAEFIPHYHTEPNHQGLDNALILGQGFGSLVSVLTLGMRSSKAKCIGANVSAGY
jgi:hypothetical protein